MKKIILLKINIFTVKPYVGLKYLPLIETCSSRVWVDQENNFIKDEYIHCEALLRTNIFTLKHCETRQRNRDQMSESQRSQLPTFPFTKTPQHFHQYYGETHQCHFPTNADIPVPGMVTNKRPWEKTGHLWNEMLEKSSKQDQAGQNQKLGDTRHSRSKTSPTAHQTTTDRVVRIHHTYAHKPTCPPGLQHQVVWLESQRKTKKMMEWLHGRHPQNSRDVPSPGHPPCCWQTAVSPCNAYRYKRKKKVKVK